MRVVALVLLFGLSAPLQCGSEPDSSLAVEETPAEALYGLAQRFRSDGERRAWRRTLEHLQARYPNSRFSVMAKEELEREDEIFDQNGREAPASRSGGAPPASE